MAYSFNISDAQFARKACEKEIDKKELAQNIKLLN